MVSFNEKKSRFSMGSSVAQCLNFVDGYCLSTDIKPTEGVANGSCLVEMDTGKLFFFDEENQRWLEFGGGV